MVQPRTLRSTWTCGASSFPVGTSGAHGAGSLSASLMWAPVSVVAKTVLPRAAVVVQPRTDVTGFVFRTGMHPPPGHRLLGDMPTPGRRQRESR